MSATCLHAAVCLAVLAAPAEPPAVERLVAQLGSADWAEREAATAKLLEMGSRAVPALEHALESSDAEVRHRAQLLIDRLRWQAPPGLPESLQGAIEHYASLPEQQRAALLAKVVSEVGKGATRLLVQVVRHDPSPEVRRQALDRLRRLDALAAEAELCSLANDPQRAAWAYQQLGDLLYRRGEAEKAIAAYEQARRAGAADPRMALVLAQLYQGRQEWAKARDVYRDLVAAQPDHLDYRRELGECYHRLGDRAKAEETWRSMLKIQRESPKAYLWLAQAYRGIGDREQELAVLREACGKHPTDFELLRQLGRTLAQEQHYAEAITVLERAAQTAGADYQRRSVNVELARLLRTSGHLRGYVERREARLAGLDREIIALLLQLAERRRAAGAVDGEREALQRLIRLYPDSPQARQAAQRVERLRP